MKFLLSLGLLSLLLTGCASTEEPLVPSEDTAGDAYVDDEGVSAEDSTEDEEIPDSPGPSEIPDDLIPSR